MPKDENVSWKEIMGRFYWIPSPFVPEDDREVIVTTTDGDVIVAQFFHNTGEWGDPKTKKIVEVSAWGYFPEPSKWKESGLIEEEKDEEPKYYMLRDAEDDCN